MQSILNFEKYKFVKIFKDHPSIADSYAAAQ